MESKNVRQKVARTASQPAGQLEAIWIKRAHRGQMDAVRSATLLEDKGLVGNADQGGRRQVAILGKEKWEKATSPLGDIAPHQRRANLYVSGLNMEETSGWTLRVGGHRLLISREATPCTLMDDIHPGLQDALRPHWSGGVYAQVLDSGEVNIGDEAVLEPPAPLSDPAQ